MRQQKVQKAVSGAHGRCVARVGQILLKIMQGPQAGPITDVK